MKNSLGSLTFWYFANMICLCLNILVLFNGYHPLNFISAILGFIAMIMAFPLVSRRLL